MVIIKDKKASTDHRGLVKWLLRFALAYCVCRWITVDIHITDPSSQFLSTTSSLSSQSMGAAMIDTTPTGHVASYNGMLRVRREEETNDEEEPEEEPVEEEPTEEETEEEETEEEEPATKEHYEEVQEEDKREQGSDEELDDGSDATTNLFGPPLYGYQSLEELNGRASRFPSFDERVRYLMSEWYVPPCEGNNEAMIVMDWRNASYADEVDANTPTPNDLWLMELPDANHNKGKFHRRRRTFRISGTAINGETIYVDREAHLRNCKSIYCKNVARFYFPALDRVDGKDYRDDPDIVPLVMQYGDAEREVAYDLPSKWNMFYPAIPKFKKYREVFPPGTFKDTAADPTQCLSGPRKSQFDLKYMPIIAKLKFSRHFGMMEDVAKADRPWSEKRNMAVFRGGLHGLTKGGLNYDELEEWPSTELCLKVPRCRLPYKFPDSKWVDAKLTRSHVPERIDGSRQLDDWLYADHGLNYEQMLEYKALIMLEGNDVATGLKWALFSNSLLMIPRITLTAWAMEELLEPWVHFVPLEDNLDDVEEKMKWIVNNDAKAQKIARQGTLWMLDMLFHPEAGPEEDAVIDEVIRRFRKHFVRGHIELADVEQPKEKGEEDKYGRNKEALGVDHYGRQTIDGRRIVITAS